MADKYYLDFVGLNTFIYEPCGFDIKNQVGKFLDGTTSGVEPISAGSFFGLVPAIGIRQDTIGAFHATEDSFDLVFAKNRNFPYALPSTVTPGTASLFPALMIHRNGPYGWPGFKAIRTGENPLTRRQRKNNLYSIVQNSQDTVVLENNKRRFLRKPRGATLLFDEPSVISNHKPLKVALGRVVKSSKKISKDIIKNLTAKQRKKIEAEAKRAGLKIENYLFRATFNNDTEFFSNEEVDRIANADVDLRSDDYDNLVDKYLEGGLNEFRSPFNIFHHMTYEQTIYPPQKYTYKSYTRQRTNFTFKWRDNILNRQESNKGDGFSINASSSDAPISQFGVVNRSIWPLDVDPNWASFGQPFIDRMGYLTGSSLSNPGMTPHYPKYHNTSSFGILWNPYSQAADSLAGGLGVALGFPNRLNDQQITKTALRSLLMRPAPLYARRHTISPTGSVSNPSGMIDIPYRLSGSHILNDHLFAGEAAWDAPKIRGRGPFYDSYESAAEKIRLIGKDYSIMPEFRISDFVNFYVSNSVGTPIDSFLKVEGGNSSFSDSTTKKFFDVYSTTEFLKNFNVVIQDHQDFVEPSEIKLKCDVISKFIPYDGFYPVQRSINLAEQFYSSYFRHTQLSFTGSTSFFGSVDTQTGSAATHAFQNLLGTLYGPGVLYNTIKSGVACDYPILTGSFLSLSSGSTGAIGISGSIDSSVFSPNRAKADYGINYFISKDFDVRVPFEAMVEPSKFLANIEIPTMEVHPSGNMSASCLWDGSGDTLYNKMANNFLAEVPNFFLKGGEFTSIKSLPEKHPNFGVARNDKRYAMRIKMYRSMNRGPTIFTKNNAEFRTPQDIISRLKDNDQKSPLFETITMYSRPSAFGPPSMGITQFTTATGINASGEVNGYNIDTEYMYVTASGQGIQVKDAFQKDSSQGFNFPYTPPYYHGESWIDVYFTPTTSKKHTLSEILSNIEYEQKRFIPDIYHATYSTDMVRGYGPQSLPRMNKNAMQLTASINPFSVGTDKPFNDDFGDSTKNNKWIIQTKFETPILNFNKYEGEDSGITMPVNNAAAQQVPRGMWHQYGEIPRNDEGVYLQVTDIPKGYLKGYKEDATAVIQKTESLVDLCGFDSTPVKLGELSNSKRFSEGIVAIPFIDTSDGKQFFRIDTDDRAPVSIRMAKDIINDKEPNRALVAAGFEVPDNQTISMVRKMMKFMIPPQFDFVKYPNAIKPFVMYIFSFGFEFSQRDLQDMWQGIMPKQGVIHRKSEASIKHSLLKGMLLDQDDVRRANIRWLVFKVKQRAETSYKEQTFRSFGEKKSGEGISKLNDIKRESEDIDPDISYNWPYDFFSMIELVKMNASIKFDDRDIDEDEGAIVGNLEDFDDIVSGIDDIF